MAKQENGKTEKAKYKKTGEADRNDCAPVQLNWGAQGLQTDVSLAFLPNIGAGFGT